MDKEGGAPILFDVEKHLIDDGWIGLGFAEWLGLFLISSGVVITNNILEVKRISFFSAFISEMVAIICHHFDDFLMRLLRITSH